ncbi:MAG: Obg family GTPase CgtA, partial [Oscillospiraceae bacterium]|nr:Obg family GTPase CgtA [Oscillospiraceae bacterium]
QGTRELVKHAAGMLDSLPPVVHYEANYVPPVPTIDTSAELSIENPEDGYWIVEGPWLEKLLDSTNLNDVDGRVYFDRVLREAGVFDRLEEMGIEDGDTVAMYYLQFEYQS